MSIRHLLVAAATTALVLPLAASPAPAHPPTSDTDAAAATAVAWQRIAVRTIFTEALTPPAAGGLYLGLHLARRRRRREGVLRQGGSARAAVATAAHDVLVEYFAATSTAILDADLANTPRGRARRTRREQGHPDRRAGGRRG